MRFEAIVHWAERRPVVEIGALEQAFAAARWPVITLHLHAPMCLDIWAWLN